MGQRNGILPIFFIAAAMYLITRYKQKEYLQGFRAYIGRMVIDGNYLVFDLHIQNPNSERIEIRSFFGEVFVNGKKVGRVEASGLQIIGGNSDSIIKLKVRPQPLQILAVAETIAKKMQAVVYFNGTMNANNEAVPIQVKYAL